ncbi:MAG TPA: DNA gyrase/topoisomerase IV subunit A [Flavobacteriales bacterium]|jgi:topoisomerase-4 subunit A|nr:DNA gyrase/topoisomerase IV subunit A [Flavobacteriales bacterium]
MEEEENGQDNSAQELDHVIRVSGMYEEWFLDYASYVILERAVPNLSDGLKPVQRRILHSMFEMEDGRFNKVANIVGNTMKYHPHGDASIGDALIQLGQRELLIDTQGNWGNIFTGDSAAASRYIEARLTPFAKEVAFNAKTTRWQNSYDGRNQEPIALPMKFPLLLAHGVEGIAVGLACKILPHNFNELIDASIQILKGRSFKIIPDFQTGGMADVSNYQDGLRGGKVKVRARIEVLDKKTLIIRDIPFGTTTTSLIDSILKANQKGKIKIRKIEDNTAEEVEIILHLPGGISPDRTMDALYAFSDCEVSISPNSSIIRDEKPAFLGVSEILKFNTQSTKDLLQKELEIRLGELENKWHISSLEKIFIEQKIYIEFDGKTYEEAKKLTLKRLQPFIKHLLRPVTDEDLEKLMEIRMRRITRHDSDKADELLLKLEEEIEEVKHDLAHLTDYAIEYFKNLKKKYGKDHPRRTEIKSFDTINAARVAVANVKLFANYQEGFIGTGLKRGEGEFVANCSDIDDVIVILNNGKFRVSKVDDKVFVGKDIRYIGIWKKGDERTTYNLIYRDGATGIVRAKRFQVSSITRDKEYDLTKGSPKTKVMYLSVNPNGEAETVQVLLRNTGKVRKLKFDFDFSDLSVKSRGAIGNILTKYPVNKITLKEKGVSTLEAQEIWFDEHVQRLNTEGRGELLGAFKGEDRILQITQSGHYRLLSYDLMNRFDDDYLIIEKWDEDKPITAVYWEGDKQQFNIKRFLPEAVSSRQLFISDHPDSYLELASTDWRPVLNISFDKRSNDRDDESIIVDEFIAVKSVKALGNRLTKHKVKSIDMKDPLPYEKNPASSSSEAEEKKEPSTPNGEEGQITLDLS